MPRFSIFTAPLFALISPDFYRDVGRNWRGKAFLYLLFLELLVWIPVTAVWFTGIHKFIADEADKFTQQIPPVSIRNGVVDVKAEQPVYIRAGDPPQDIAILDTTGKVTSLEGTKAQFLLTKNSLVSKKNEFQTQTIDLKEVEEFDIDGPTVRRWIDVGADWLPFLFYPFIVVISFILRIILALIYSLIGLIINSVTGAQLSYGGILAICIVSLTPPILLKTLLELTKTELPGAWFIGFTLAIGYIALAINANRSEAQEVSLPRGEL